jgi:hypothetical protein
MRASPIVAADLAGLQGNGNFGFVAEQRGVPLGAGWARLFGRCPPHRDVCDPKARPETQPFVEGVHAGICSTALHQDMVAVSPPCMFQGSPNHSLAVTSAAQLRMSDDVLQEAVASSAAQQIRCNDEHAGCGDPIAIVGYEYVDARVRQRLLPDALGAFARQRGRTDLRHFEQGEE